MREHPHYEVFEELGKGPNTVVYRARNMITQQEVAIKEVKEECRADEDEVRRLRDSAHLLSNLANYDHVLHVYNLIPENDWLVLERMEGSLADRLAEEPDGLPPDLVRSAVRQALRGLRILHAAGRFHGDLKPSNLLINEHGRVKIADSPGLMADGIARIPDKTFKYMAPEQVDPSYGPVGPATDLYILGFAALELLKGAGFNNLFKGTRGDGGNSGDAWMRLHGSRHEVIPSADKIISNLPLDLVQVIDRMLQKNVAQRYASAEEALEVLKSGQEIEIRTGGSRPPDVAPQVKMADTKPLLSEMEKDQKATGQNWKRLLTAALASLFVTVALGAVALKLLTWGELVEFRLTTTPEGASVTFLDPDEPDRPPSRKKTPNVYSVVAKKQFVRIQLEGHEMVEQEIDPVQQKDASVVLKRLYDIQLQPENQKLVGSEVDLDGKKIGKLPLSVKLTEGTYFVLITMPGQQSIRKELVVKANKVVLICPDKGTPDLPKEESVAVTIHSNPSGAQVRVEGKEGVTPQLVRLKPGSYEVEIDKSGYFPLVGRLVVNKKPGEMLDATFDLNPYVLVKVGSTPSEARLRVKGEIKGITPVEFKLGPGTYPLRLEKDKYEVKDATLVVHGDPGAVQSETYHLTATRLVEHLAYFKKGKELLREGKHKDAEEEFTRALKIKADFAPGYAYRADAYLGLAVEEPREKYLDEAMKDCQTALQYDSSLAEAYAFRGEVHAYRNRVNEAWTDCIKAVELNDKLARAYRNLGYLYAFLNGPKRNLDQALKEYNIAIQEDSEVGPWYVERGKIQVELGKHKEAIDQSFSNALLQNHKTGELYALRGHAWLQIGRTKEALQDLNEAINIYGSKSAIVYADRGNVSFQKADYTAAIIDYTSAIELAPKEGLDKASQATLYKNRGNAYCRDRQLNNAAVDLKAAINLNSQDWETHARLADVLVDQGDFGKAQEHRDLSEKLKSITPP